jgi:hypothetical protein
LHPPGLSLIMHVFYQVWAVCIELNRYIDVFYSILVIIILGAYNERVNETPL